MIINDRIPLDSLGSLGIPEPRPSEDTPMHTPPYEVPEGPPVISHYPTRVPSQVAVRIVDKNRRPIHRAFVELWGPKPAVGPDPLMPHMFRDRPSLIPGGAKGTDENGVVRATVNLPKGSSVYMTVWSAGKSEEAFSVTTQLPNKVPTQFTYGGSSQPIGPLPLQPTKPVMVAEDKLILPEGEMDLDKREQEKIRGYFTWHAVIVRDGKPVAGVEVELLNGSPGNPFGERGIIEGLGIDEALGRGRTDSQGRVAIPVNPPWSLLGGRRNREESNARAKQLFNMFKGIYAKIYAPGLPESKSFFRDVWPVRMEGSENLNPAVQSGDYDISLLDSGRLRAKVKAPTLANPYFINLPPTTKGAGWEEYLPYIMSGVGVLGISTILFLTLKK